MPDFPATAWRRVLPYNAAASASVSPSSALTGRPGEELHHRPLSLEAPARIPGTVAAEQRTSDVPQVSISSAQTLHPPPFPANRYSKALEVVRVQRQVLQDGTVEGSVNDETWTSAHVIMDYVNLTTKSRTLKLRYVNGDEEDVCEGAVDRPERRRVVKSKASCSRDRSAAVPQ
jgi:hypothetical protein